MLNNIIKGVLAYIVIDSLTEKSTNSFYVEVSARRSGKTTRLADNMINYITKTNNPVYLITPNLEMWEYIRDNYIPKSLHHKVWKIPKENRHKDIRIYVDEPGSVTKTEHKIISNNGYYAGTPQGKVTYNDAGQIEDNFLYALVKYNNGEYTSYKTNMHSDDFKGLKTNVPQSIFRQEALGEFVDGI